MCGDAQGNALDICDELVRSLSRRRTPEALALLRSLSSVAPPPLCHRALFGASTLAKAGVERAKEFTWHSSAEVHLAAWTRAIG